MAMISGGNVITKSAMVDTKEHIVWVDALPTDANVGGGYRTPANGEYACNITNSQVYERQGGAWVRIDTV